MGLPKLTLFKYALLAQIQELISLSTAQTCGEFCPSDRIDLEFRFCYLSNYFTSAMSIPSRICFQVGFRTVS